MPCCCFLIAADAADGFVAAEAKTRPIPNYRADDTVGHESDQNNKHQAENEFPQIANGGHLLQHVAQDQPDRSANCWPDQRSRSANHRLNDKLA